ncbi:uncharacterized protein CheB42a [Drosophila kikkawai]|uniref:Uncharacterized protein CheB42a n=1 Tax=Drosophila kikkawai TaxID=30033 RepID=A0A6P4J8Y0_DROKI|nr:uncharacterized protein LOC108080718 [Drosophila kikkawai]
MWTKLRIVVFQLCLITLTQATEYQFKIDDEGVYRPCENQPGNPSNVDALLDMSKLKVATHGGVLEIEGEPPVIWKDVQPGDTITFLGQIYRMEHNTWQKTMFSASSKNFCRNMFEKGQLWYQFWTQHITNSDEIKTKCLNTPGAVLKIEKYQLEMKANVNIPSFEGRYKLVILLEAFDKRNTKRPVSICTEIRGNMVKV